MLSMRHKCGHIIKDDREIDATLLQGNGDDVAPDGVQMGVFDNLKGNHPAAL
jgi:hypothetical protein